MRAHTRIQCTTCKMYSIGKLHTCTVHRTVQRTYERTYFLTLLPPEFQNNTVHCSIKEGGKIEQMYNLHMYGVTHTVCEESACDSGVRTYAARHMKHTKAN